MRFRSRGGLGRRSSYGSEKKFGLRWLFLTVFVVGLAWFAHRKYINHNLNNANTALQENNFSDARKYFNRAAAVPLSKNIGEDGLGAIALLEGSGDADVHFQTILQDRPSRFGGDPGIILQKFLETGRYQQGRGYVAFLKEWRDQEALQPYVLDFATISLGSRELEEAKNFMGQALNFQKEEERYRRLSKQLETVENDGGIPVIIDRNNHPILFFQLREDKYEFDSPKLFEGWGEADGENGFLAGISETDLHNRITTTIDINLQKAAHQAMKGYEGTMVLMDPKTGDLLAAYGTEGQHPFRAGFEPGSVIKVLTYGIFLEEDGDVSGYAPKDYPGFEKIGGKLFYDWTTQGRLDTVDEGMAVSCNLMFAQMGIDLGWPKLSNGFRNIFGAQVHPDGFLGEAGYGRIVRDPENAYELGRIAIGLDLLETTSLGLVLIPGATANQGKLPLPRLIQHFANLEGNAYKTVPAKSGGKLFSPETADALTQSMIESLRNERGTARRAEVDFLNSAMKTGTAGERPFDSIMIGLFPIENPKVAFAFYLNKGGKCEINGARVAKNLQEQIRALAPGYMEQ